MLVILVLPFLKNSSSERVEVWPWGGILYQNGISFHGTRAVFTSINESLVKPIQNEKTAEAIGVVFIVFEGSLELMIRGWVIKS